MKPAALLLLLSGCASFQGVPFSPSLDEVKVRVIWQTREQIEKAKPGACGYWRPGLDGGAELYVVKPTSWDDWTRFAVMGHELGHGLLAKHGPDEGGMPC